MDHNILISVIIPAYNAEKYLDRAVQSVLCQMDGSIELILVDDGSTDGTGVMCDGYAEKHPNVRVVHKHNGGLSSARNAGIAVAMGEYLMFLDADDYIEPDACREVSEVIQSKHPDIIDFGWRYVSNGVAMPPEFHKLPKNTLLEEQELIEWILPPVLNLRNDPDNFISTFSCTKVFSLNIIRNNRMCFDEKRRIWEDRPFVVQYLRHCKNFYAMDRCFYNYVDVPGSLSRKYSFDFFRIIIENYQLYRRLFEKDYNFETEYVNGYWSRSIDSMIFRSLEQTQNKEQIRKNVLDTLNNETVKQWYANRTAKNGFEERIGQLVSEGRSKEALQNYERQFRKQRMKSICTRIFGSIKNRIKKVLGR